MPASSKAAPQPSFDASVERKTEGLPCEMNPNEESTFSFQITSSLASSVGEVTASKSPQCSWRLSIFRFSSPLWCSLPNSMPGKEEQILPKITAMEQIVGLSSKKVCAHVHDDLCLLWSKPNCYCAGAKNETQHSNLLWFSDKPGLASRVL